MARQRKQATTTGSIGGKAPILASEKPNTAGELKQSRPDTGSGQSGTKPMSMAEALSLWQTSCSDLQLYGFRVAILARGNRLYFIAVPPASIENLTFDKGHVKINGLPVSDL